MLLATARQGLGLAILPRFLARSDLDSGSLEEGMPEFTMEPLWVKVCVLRIKMNKVVVSEFVYYVQKPFSEGVPDQVIRCSKT